MAWPNPIKTSGSLSQTSDLFEYFKGALYQTPSNPVFDMWRFDAEDWPRTAGFNFEWIGKIMWNDDWGDTSYINANTVLPITRIQFYDYCDKWSSPNRTSLETAGMFNVVNALGMYGYSEPISGWNTYIVNDWGKQKCMELALFGNVANGGDWTATTLSTFNGQTLRNSINNWTRSDLNYLRYALTRFETYGSCHPIIES